MLQPQAQIHTTFTHKAGLVQATWYDLGAELPDLPWQQVYVIGDIDGKVPIVHYAGNDRDNLPGGKTEPGETTDETIQREMREELNCTAEQWAPLGYQKCIESDGAVVYQLRVAARLRVLGPFENDPGGSVIGYSLISLNELNSYIRYGEVGDRLVQLAQAVRY